MAAYVVATQVYDSGADLVLNVGDLVVTIVVDGDDGGEMRVRSCFGSVASGLGGDDKVDLVATTGVEMVRRCYLQCLRRQGWP